MEDSGWYSITYDGLHREYRLFPTDRYMYSPRRNQVEVIDSDLQIYKVLVGAVDREEGLSVGRVLISNYLRLPQEEVTNGNT